MELMLCLRWPLFKASGFISIGTTICRRISTQCLPDMTFPLTLKQWNPRVIFRSDSSELFWAECHRDELLDNWNLIAAKEMHYEISPEL
jgi:hypothetical protein